MSDAIETLMGGFGKFHLGLYLLLSVCQPFMAFNLMAIIFLAPKVSYTCDGVKDVCPCPNPVFDKSVFPSTITMEWKLICEKKPLVSMHQSMFQLGTLTGSVVFGMAADRFGRRGPLLFACMCHIIFGISSAFIPSFWIMTFVRFLVGMTVGGTMVVSFVLLMEFLGAKYREVFSALYQFPFNVGHMIMPVLSYFFRGYKEYLLSTSLPSLLMLSYICLIPESARWLLAMKRTDESIRIIEKVAKINKRDTTNLKTTVIEFQAVMETNKLKKGTILDLFRTPNIRKNMICITLDWLSCAYCFYGVSQYVGQLSGNIFLNVFISATLVGMGTLFAIPLLKVFGRRSLIVGNNYICAICLIILAFIPQGTVSVILATIGVITSFTVFILVYLYTVELFPTVIRNAALGFASMIARVGSMVAPFVLDLGEISYMLPPLVFASVPLVAGTASLFLPETKGLPLTTTIEEGERLGKKQPSNQA